MNDEGGQTGGGSFHGRCSSLIPLLGVLAVAAQCAPSIKRDYSNVPAGRVGFDDMCGLQTYFDRLEMKVGTPPAVASSNEIQGQGFRSGRSRFTFQTDSQLQTARQVLTDNWKRLPDNLMSSSIIEIEVRWSERSGVRRVVTNEDATLMVGKTESSLPYHVCLSELLFGEPLYRRRRVALGLAPLPGSSPVLEIVHGDGGVPDGPAPAPILVSPDAGTATQLH